jgi:lycopene beta-cyclase
MDLRPAGPGPPTFCYVVPTGSGWLVEETVLAARPAVDPAELAGRLAARLGALPAGRTELVAIPLGGHLPSRTGPVPSFGAAAGYTHPTTGFSVAASLRAAPRVADAITAACRSAGRPRAAAVWDAVWPAPARRTRRLHDYGLRVILRLDQEDLATFFDEFFSLPRAQWADYLRIDASPRAVSRTMWSLARRLPRGVRRQLLVPPFGAC